VDGRLPLPEGYQVRLPTEVKWERVARGTDGRKYPWSGEFDSNCANTYESGIGGTTAVCTYPQGKSPLGAWNMAGNVWEWTDSTEGRYRVVRGGSWCNHWWIAHCALRSRFDPDNPYDYTWASRVGFRVVVSLANSEF
jgi:formylglycine-generating enzyme required for sulfatase activity